jgi:hypothetical protein
MLRRLVAVAVLAALLGSGLSCLDPMHLPESFAPLPGVKPGDKPADVVKTMNGYPDADAPGYWIRSDRFSMDHKVWYYGKKGRVVFDRRENVVYTSEADPQEDGRP